MVFLPLLGIFPVKVELPWLVPQPGWLEQQKGICSQFWGQTSELKVLAKPLAPDLSPRLVAGCLLPVLSCGRASVRVCVQTPPLTRTPSPPSLPHFRFSAASNTRSPGALEFWDTAVWALACEFGELEAECSTSAHGDVRCPALSGIRLPRLRCCLLCCLLPASHMIIMKNFRHREKWQKYYSAFLLPYLLQSVTVNLLYLLHRSV